MNTTVTKDIKTKRDIVEKLKMHWKEDKERLMKRQNDLIMEQNDIALRLLEIDKRIEELEDIAIK